MLVQAGGNSMMKKLSLLTAGACLLVLHFFAGGTGVLQHNDRTLCANHGMEDGRCTSSLQDDFFLNTWSRWM